MFLFYAPEVTNGNCCFSPAESRHCAKVLRLLPGQEVWVTDGVGFLYLAELSVVSDKACMARVRKVLRSPDEAGNGRPPVHIVMAPTKNMERTEWFLEKATEVGLGKISFIRTEHSERKVVKLERVESILVAAMKQSQQAYLPLQQEMCSLDEYLKRAEVGQDTDVQKFIAYCGAEYEKKSYLELLQAGTPVEVMIGPEGDFSPGEVKKCVKAGYVPVSLGDTRLRTETAALFAAWAPAFLKGAKKIVLSCLLFLCLSLVGIKAQQIQIGLLKYRGGGDWYANPTSLPNLIAFANREAGMDLDPQPVTVEVGGQALFGCPFVHMTGHGNVVFSAAEIQNLRAYLLGGGFLHIDDNYGMDKFIRAQMKKAFPELDFVELPASHPVFRQTFDYSRTGLPKIHEHDAKRPQAFALFYEGRMICFYTYECDLGDGWEDTEVHGDTPEAHRRALEMGTNLLQYVFMQ